LCVKIKVDFYSCLLRGGEQSWPERERTVKESIVIVCAD